jgi:DNA-binding CsgD family transcriptional regulator
VRQRNLLHPSAHGRKNSGEKSGPVLRTDCDLINRGEFAARNKRRPAWRLGKTCHRKGKMIMEPTRRHKAIRETVPKLHSEIEALQLQLTQAKATIARLSEERRVPGSTSKRNKLVAQKYEFLSPREKEVVRLFLEEPCDKRVAKRLGTRPQTVRNQISSIEKKLGVESREELVICLLALFNSPEEDS